MTVMFFSLRPRPASASYSPESRRATQRRNRDCALRSLTGEIPSVRPDRLLLLKEDAERFVEQVNGEDVKKKFSP